MSDISTALAGAAHEPRNEPDMPAARRRGQRLRHRRASRIAVALVAVTATATFAAVGVHPRPQHSRLRVAGSSHGWTTATSSASSTLEIQYPAGWGVARTSLTPHLSDPLEVFALGTFPMAPADHNCAHVPVNALEALGPTDAFIWITERTDSPGDPAGTFGPRPRSFAPTSGTNPDGGDLTGCLNHPLAGTAREISFDDHNRHFTITYAIGTDATKQRRADVLTIINSFTVN